MSAEIVDETSAAVADAGAPPRETARQRPRRAPGRAADRPLAAAAAAVMEVLLEAVGRSNGEVVVLLTGDERVRELNRQWRGKDLPTDVLSFSQLEGEAIGADTDLLGDIVVSVDTLRRQARDGGWSDEEELSRLLVHGLLHLLGYDHERAADEAAMKAQEARLARALFDRGIACAWEEDAR